MTRIGGVDGRENSAVRAGSRPAGVSAPQHHRAVVPGSQPTSVGRIREPVGDVAGRTVGLARVEALTTPTSRGGTRRLVELADPPGRTSGRPRRPPATVSSAAAASGRATVPTV